MTIKEMKAHLKTLAASIRQHRREYKDAQRGRGVDWTAPYWKVFAESDQFRYEHVAYCLVRGRKYEEIERTVHEGNEIDMEKVEKILATIVLEKAVVTDSDPNSSNKDSYGEKAG